LAVSLEPPEKLRSLQGKLYDKAKAEPGYRFYLLYDKIHRPDVLAHAYALVRRNDGAPGVDGVTFDRIEAAGLADWLAGLAEELRTKRYRAQPVRRVLIPKPGGGERPLGIPTIRDRVAQTAAKLVLEPIFEADLEPTAYGYRPDRSAIDAVEAVHKRLLEGYTAVVDADLSKYFDSIPHAALMQSVARRISDRHVLHLIKMWLTVPVEETDDGGGKRLTGGKSNRTGTPQGGVISPLLANLYFNRVLKYWRITGCGEAFRAHIVNYADDFVILSRGKAAEALAWTRRTMRRLDLTLNEAKTTLKAARTERFDFLGYSFGPHCHRLTGRRYLGASPSAKSLARIKSKLSDVLARGNKAPWPTVRDQVNRLLRGWQGYFRYGSCALAYRAVNRHVVDRTRAFLVDRHRLNSHGTRQYRFDTVFGELGIHALRTKAAAAPGTLS
jgi:RNA-directed DNA polymerase